jgi:hypothetical protein
MSTLDPNVWTSLARQYTGGMAAPVAGQAGYAAIANTGSNNLVYVPSIVGADNGDAAATLVPGTSAMTQRWDTTLTADRAVSLGTTTAWNGARFRIVRTGAGAFDLNVGTGPLKALATDTWCDVEYDGSAWVLTAYGSL